MPATPNVSRQPRRALTAVTVMFRQSRDHPRPEPNRRRSRIRERQAGVPVALPERPDAPDAGSRAVERAVGQYRPTRGWAQQEVTGEDEDSSRSGESDQVRDMLSVVISFPERLCGHR